MHRVERLRSALENLDEAIDMAENALGRRQKEIEKAIDARAEKRVKSATETAERALKQSREREHEAISRERRQREATAKVSSRLDSAIHRLERLVGE